MSLRDRLITLHVTFVWGLGFVAIKKVLEHSPPLTTAGLRFLLAGLLLVPLVGRVGSGRMPTWREVVVVGLLQTTGLYGFGFLGIERATAGAASLLVNTNPVFVALLSPLLLRARLRAVELAGIGLSVVGIAVISLDGSLGTPLGLALLVAGAVSWAGGSIAVKRVGEVDLLALSAGQMVVGSLPLLALGVAGEHTLPRFDLEGFAWFVFLVPYAGSLNFVLWFEVLARNGTVGVSSWLFLIPVFGVLAGVALLDEPLGWRLLIGGGLVLAGVVLTNRPPTADRVVLHAP